MARTKLVAYRLTPKARNDLKDIWRYGADTWSPDQADRYLDELLAKFGTLLAHPEMARERAEFDPPVRIHPSGPHLIIYTINKSYLDIIRILSSRPNWEALLSALDD